MNDLELARENRQLRQRLAWAAAEVLSLQNELEFTRARLEEALGLGADMSQLVFAEIDAMKEALS